MNPSSAPLVTATASPTGAPVRPIHLGALPAEGIAVGFGSRVVLLDTDGRLLARVRGLSLYYEWTVPGPVIFRRDDTFFALQPDRGVLRPLPGRDAAARLAPQFQPNVDLPRPADARKGSDRWVYALPGPDGFALAQWSGECEVPNAMLVPAGGSPVSPTGEARLSSAPQSFALGWDDRGRALIDLPEGDCGTSYDRPGIYAFTSPGIGELVYAGRDIQGARMWGPAA
jgi:hypothetical protein